MKYVLFMCFRTMNTYLLVFLGLLLFEAAICTGLKYGWQDTDTGKGWYIPYGNTTNKVRLVSG